MALVAGAMIELALFVLAVAVAILAKVCWGLNKRLAVMEKTRRDHTLSQLAINRSILATMKVQGQRLYSLETKDNAARQVTLQ